MAKKLVPIAISAVFAAAVLAGPATAKNHKPAKPDTPAATTSDDSAPTPNAGGGGRFRI